MTDTWDELIDEVIAEYRHGCNNARSALRAAIDAVVFEAAESMRQYDHQQERACDAEARVAALEAQLAEAEIDTRNLKNELSSMKDWLNSLIHNRDFPGWFYEQMGTQINFITDAIDKYVTRLSKRGQG